MVHPVPADDTISSAQLATTVDLACRAPSLHNSQPWRWLFEKGTLHLFADMPESVVTPTPPDGK